MGLLKILSFLSFFIVSSFTILLMPRAIHAQVSNQQSEILEDLVDATSKIAYRLEVLGQYKELSTAFTMYSSDRDMGPSELNTRFSHSSSITGGVSTYAGLISLAEGMIIGDKLILYSGTSSVTVGGISLMNSSFGSEGSMVAVADVDMQKDDLMSSEYSVRQFAQKMLNQTLVVTGLQSIPVRKKLKFLDAIEAKIRDGRVRCSREAKSELGQAAQQVCIKPFSVAEIMFEQKLLSKKQQAALQSLLDKHRGVITHTSKFDSAPFRVHTDRTRLQLKQSRRVLSVLKEVAVDCCLAKDSAGIQSEMDALEQAIIEAEELLVEELLAE